MRILTTSWIMQSTRVYNILLFKEIVVKFGFIIKLSDQSEVQIRISKQHQADGKSVNPQIPQQAN
jgi:hypothetical protein